MASVSISLPESLKEYIEEQVANGGYSNSSEYLHDLILEDKRRKTEERLESLLLEGLESGDSIAVTPEFWDNLWTRVDSQKSEASREASSK